MSADFTVESVTELLTGLTAGDRHEAQARMLVDLVDRAETECVGGPPGRFVLCVASVLLIGLSALAGEPCAATVPVGPGTTAGDDYPTDRESADATTPSPGQVADAESGSRAETGPVGTRLLVVLEAWLSGYDYVLRAPHRAQRSVIEVAARYGLAEAVATAINGSVAARAIAPPNGQMDLAAGGDPADMTEIKAWLSEYISHPETGLSLIHLDEDTQMGSAPHSYVGCSITAVTLTVVETNEQASGQIAGVLGAAGITTHQPIVEDSPRRGPSWSDRPETRLIDELQVARCSLVVVLLDDPAVGLGNLIEMAVRYNVRVLVLTNNSRVTPMVVGASDVVRVAAAGSDPAAALYAHLVRMWPLLVRHSRGLRANVTRWVRQIEGFRERLNNLPEETLLGEDFADISHLRLRQLLHHPELWGGATRREIEELEAVVGAREPVALTRPELRALVKASHELGLTSAEEDRLEVAGRAARSSDAFVMQRADTHQPAWWMELWVRHVA